jgi:uncharacterized membrane protein
MTNQQQQNNYDMWHRNPDNWRFGVFYVNRKDPRLFVPKKNPMMGMTLNFGNPLSYLLIFAIGLLIVISVKYI